MGMPQSLVRLVSKMESPSPEGIVPIRTNRRRSIRRSAQLEQTRDALMSTTSEQLVSKS